MQLVLAKSGARTSKNQQPKMSIFPARAKKKVFYVVRSFGDEDDDNSVVKKGLRKTWLLTKHFMHYPLQTTVAR